MQLHPVRASVGCDSAFVELAAETPVTKQGSASASVALRKDAEGRLVVLKGALKTEYQLR